jgi:hypothetical protein
MARAQPDQVARRDRAAPGLTPGPAEDSPTGGGHAKVPPVSCGGEIMTYRSINLGQKFGLFAEQWQPKVIAEMNDYQFKLARLEGDFVWHDHKDTDETFIVLEGAAPAKLRPGASRAATRRWRWSPG